MSYRICLFVLCLHLTASVYATVSQLECVLVGSTWRANCSSNISTPLPDTSWYKDNSVLNNVNFLLEIHNFAQSDYGTYICANTFNNAVVYSNYSIISYEAITFHSPLSYSVSLGATINILCNVTGKPNLSFSWFRNSIPLNLSPGTQNIHIPSVAPEHAGEYECQVTNQCENQTFPISVAIISNSSSTFQLSQGAIIGIVVAAILCLFVTVICGFITLVQIRKFLSPIIRGSKSGSSRGSIYSDESKLRRKKAIIHSSSHRNSVTDLFVQEGIIHDNPVFIEGIANEKARAFSNLIGIPQTQAPTQTEDQTSHLSLAGSTTGGKHYSSDDLELKTVDPTMDMQRSKSLRSSRTEKKEFMADTHRDKPAPYEHRFTPKSYHSNWGGVLELTPKREVADAIAETRKIFDNPDLISSPPKFKFRPEAELRSDLVPIGDRKKRKISLDDELRVTPGDMSDFLTSGAKRDSDSSDEDELIAALPIKMPHSTETHQTQEPAHALREFQRANQELSWDELDLHFHVLDTFVSSATFLTDTRQKRAASAGTKTSQNLESILEESPSMVRIAESSATRLGVRKATSLQLKVSRFDGEGDPWIDGELAHIPKRIVATRSKRFDSKYF